MEIHRICYFKLPVGETACLGTYYISFCLYLASFEEINKKLYSFKLTIDDLKCLTRSDLLECEVKITYSTIYLLFCNISAFNFLKLIKPL